MSRKLSDIASRFKAAIDAEAQAAVAEEEARRAEEARQAARLAEAITARDALLTELEAFAAAVPGTKSKRAKDGSVTLTREEYKLVFKPVAGQPVVAVEYPAADEGERLRLDLTSDEDTWVLETDRRVVPLFDEGFEDLCVNALGLPRPERTAAPAPARGASAHGTPSRSAAPAAATSDKSIKQVLADRRREKRANHPGHTKIIGKNHSPWDVRPSNPDLAQPTAAPTAAPAPAQAGKRPSAASEADVWDARTVHTEAENPHRKRQFKSDAEAPVGSAVKKYKPIL
jgi:hypothetical protein